MANFEERLRKDLRTIIPIDLDFNITMASDPIIDTWKGATLMSKNIHYMTKKDYDEFGSDYFKQEIYSKVE